MAPLKSRVKRLQTFPHYDWNLLLWEYERMGRDRIIEAHTWLS